jgi:UDP-glucose 4-epimerase
MEVIEIAREITGREIPTKLGPRRPGDPAVLIASSEEIKRNLGWSARFGDLRSIIESAWTLMQIKGKDRIAPADELSWSKV